MSCDVTHHGFSRPQQVEKRHYSGCKDSRVTVARTYHFGKGQGRINLSSLSRVICRTLNYFPAALPNSFSAIFPRLVFRTFISHYFLVKRRYRFVDTSLVRVNFHCRFVGRPYLYDYFAILD